ncbi:iron transport ATP-binding protein [Salmonella enterica subsp. enterica serovar Daytona]|uniref:Iron transport ATP-binding protein n=1 Tax=Salmonella enterica subsp. enterica serovar Daytona TaxID=1962639 RepID=A0A447JDH2_SALET|nr:iron transport ATP-binding protein [Salmonella enterica subsp. enterica serovar Daytona]
MNLFTGVDVKTEARIIDLLRELRDEGRTMLVSTHNLGSVTEFCDYTVMIKRNRTGQRPYRNHVYRRESGTGV